MLRRALVLIVLCCAVPAAPAAARVAPVAALSGPAVLKAGYEVTFDAGSSSADPAGSIVEYAWDLDGSGAFATKRTTPTLKVTLREPGDITVAVRVTDDVGASSIAVGHFLVEGPPPVARITVPSPVLAGQPVTLDASSSTAPAGRLVAYAWDLDGNGYGADSDAPTTTTTFPAPGSYTVSLRVQDQAHGTDTVTKTIEVVDPASLTATLAGDPAAGILALDDTALQYIQRGSTGRFAAVNGAAKRRIRTVRGRGLWVNLVTDRSARFTLNLLVARDVARVLGLKGVRVGKRVPLARVRTSLTTGGQRPQLLALSKANRRKLRAPISLTVQGTAVDANGNKTVLRRAFALRR
jgi:PKD repeat protein